MLLAVLFAGERAAAASANGCEIEALALAGNELSLVVLTSQSHSFMHTSGRSDVDYWYVRANIADPNPLARAIVVGPLWPRATDAAQLRDLRRGLRLLPDGRLIRDAGTESARELNFTSRAAEWLDARAVVLPPDIRTGNDQPRFQTLSGSVVVQEERSVVRAYDLNLGEKIEPRGLAAVMTAWTKNRGLYAENGQRTVLTEDLKYVVVWSNSRYRDPSNGYADTFQVQGKSYSRGSYSAYFNNGDSEPRIVSKAQVLQGESEIAYRGAFSVDGKLLFLTSSSTALKLTDVTGRVVYSHGPAEFGSKLLHDAQQDAIVFPYHPYGEPLTLRIWSYKQNKLTEPKVDYAALFKPNLLGGMRPLSGVSIRK